MSKDKENNSFAEHVRDLRGHIRAFRQGQLDQVSLLLLIEVTVEKMKLVSAKVTKALLRDADGF